MSVEIESVISRSEQGVLRPFLCVGANGLQYFVKGRGAGRTNLITEYIVGRLGQTLHLPIAPFEIVNVPQALIAGSAVEGIGELGTGPAFGSEKVPFGQELGRLHLTRVPQELRRRVLLFDWWVQNEDRSFGPAGGNPNLLWNTETQQLVVIDHNLAFDIDFGADRFWGNHIFREERSAFLDEHFCQEQRAAFEMALQSLPKILLELPDEWAYEDSFQTVAADFDFQRATSILNRHNTEEFWNATI